MEVTKVLMIAFNNSFVELLERSARKYELYVIEENEIYEKSSKNFHKEIIKGVLLGEYQQSEQFLQEAIRWHSDIKFDVVVPGLEYGVKAATLFALKCGLTNPGEKAIDAFTDKYKLRSFCKGLNVPQPKYLQVKGLKDVSLFFEDGFTPIVLKPTNRRGSIGVQLIHNEVDLEAAWEATTTVKENSPIQRRIRQEYLVEEYAGGYEVSIESLVYKSKPIFHNITLKSTVEGMHPVEKSHIVPAPLTDRDREQLINYKENLLFGLNVEAGFFHSEWKVDATGPKLIECAARLAGDFIPELITKAYGFNIAEAFIDVMMNKKPQIITKPRYVTANHYFFPKPGKLREIEGVEFLKKSPFIWGYRIKTNLGDTIGPITCSMDRPGSCMIIADTSEDVLNYMKEVDKTVVFLTENNK
ncbi:ATP-grasp domain-containing protein [Bacillus cereus]|uniref:ATP-grasp domain-containing protein n=1 Tax=Bacillus cereus TaxID=1396 RepID=UPI0018F77551|nr:ATP-grasp domain-containing protein [Bacillus cereus]MBJ8153882.1 ATP-grasp domain-containing protein [Bacillus cereus]